MQKNLIAWIAETLGYNPGPARSYRFGKLETGSLAAGPVSSCGSIAGRSFSIRACRLHAPNPLTRGGGIFFQFLGGSVKYLDAVVRGKNRKRRDVGSFDIEIVHRPGSVIAGVSRSRNRPLIPRIKTEILT